MHGIPVHDSESYIVERGILCLGCFQTQSWAVCEVNFVWSHGGDHPGLSRKRKKRVLHQRRFTKHCSIACISATVVSSVFCSLMWLATVDWISSEWLFLMFLNKIKISKDRDTGLPSRGQKFFPVIIKINPKKNKWIRKKYGMLAVFFWLYQSLPSSMYGAQLTLGS